MNGYLRAYLARLGHYTHDLSMFSCLAFFEGHWLALTVAGTLVTLVIVAISIHLWKEIE